MLLKIIRSSSYSDKYAVYS